MPLKSVKLATMNESRLRIKLQPSEVPSVNFLREKVSRRLDSESLDPILGMIALCYWVFSPSETRFTVIPLVFALGSLTLLVKGVFLLRNSSEGSVFRDRNSPSSPTLLFASPFRRFLPKPLKLFRISAQVPYSFGHFSCSVKILQFLE
jgi:hypothetical protein